MASEFDLIARYFTRPAHRARLGVGDDCALLDVTPGCELAISTDMLVAGTHFFPDADPQRLGHKTLAVNLSDLAAMGAKPASALLSLALPAADEAWIAAFARGFFALADEHGVELVGGDTTRTPSGGTLTLTVTILGEVPASQAIRRSGAKAGDDIWVSNTLGDAALGLAVLQGKVNLEQSERYYCIQRLEMPAPRIALGLALRGIAHSMLDISDGLAGDLAHIARASGVSAQVDVDVLPLSPALRGVARELALQCALAGGDDYELCFTAAAERRTAVEAAGTAAGVSVTRIGSIVPAAAVPVRFVDGVGHELALRLGGYDHFGA
ncbi:MAG: thiamine-monophosphate kinase [Betaproteobacteria bacterium]|nr:thiamine-monophosphate kinase [Betaproteobacteria bacterium]